MTRATHPLHYKIIELICTNGSGALLNRRQRLEPVETFTTSTRPIKTMQLTTLNRIMIQLHLQVQSFTCHKKRRENQHTSKR